MKLPTSIDASTGALQKRFADSNVQAERLTSEIASDPSALARVLTRMWEQIRRLAQALAMVRPPFRVLNQTVGTGGAQFTITHKLGYVPTWRPIGWRGAAGGHSLVEVSRDANTLVLASYVAGTVDLELS